MFRIRDYEKKNIRIDFNIVFLSHAVSLARVISIANISPNWLIILPVFFGFCGKNEGMFVGFAV